MFNKKKDNTEEKQINKDAPDGTIEAPPLKPFSGKAKHSPSKPPVSTAFQPDITRRQSDFPSAARLRTERSLGSSYDSRRLVVGRDIRLKGEITACDKLLVEGHVEIVLPEAGSIEIASSGFFKGKAEVNEADISGNFEGSLKAHDLLIVRSGGRVSGTIRYGKIVVESGGEISGDTKNLSKSKTSPDEKNSTNKK